MKKLFKLKPIRIILLSIAFIIFTQNIVNAQVITTVAGNGTRSFSGDGGPATNAEFFHPENPALDSIGNLYIDDVGNYRVRKVNTAGIITTFAGTGSYGFSGDGGPATAAIITGGGLAFDRHGNLYIGDAGNNRIRKVDAAGIITTIAGTGASGYSGDGGQATNAELNNPEFVYADSSGNVYIADELNYRIRKINPAGIITTIAGTGTPGFSGDGGPATAAQINAMIGIAADNAGNVYFSDVFSYRIRMVTPLGIITTIAGTGSGSYSGDGGPATAAGISENDGIAVDRHGNIYMSGTTDGRIRKINSMGIISTIAGNGTFCGFYGDGGPADSAALCGSYGICVAVNGNVYFADEGNERIRKINYAALPVNDPKESYEGINVFPNPSISGLFTIRLSSAVNEEAQISIIDIIGAKINELTTTTNKSSAIKLDAPPGIYFLNAITAHGSWSEKVVVSR